MGILNGRKHPIQSVHIQSQLVWAECVGCPWTLLWNEVTIIFGIICHNLGQPKAKSPRLVIYSIKKPTHTGDHCIWAAPGKLGVWSLVCNLISTRLCRWNKEDDQHIYWKWKTTLIFWKWNGTAIFLKMKDDLNCLTNERWLQYFWKSKTTPI